MGDETDDELPGLQLATRALMAVRVILVERGLIPAQEGKDATDQIKPLWLCERWGK